jgi:hypothetical protein
MSVVLNWNGKGIPDELRALPPGRYVIEAVDEAPELTDDEQEGIEAALASVRHETKPAGGSPTTSSADKVKRWRADLLEIHADVGMLEQLDGGFTTIQFLLRPRGSYYLLRWAHMAGGQAIVVGIRRHLMPPDKASDVTLIGMLTGMLEKGFCKSLLDEIGEEVLAKRIGCTREDTLPRLRASLNSYRKRLQDDGEPTRRLADRIAHLREGNTTDPPTPVLIADIKDLLGHLRDAIRGCALILGEEQIQRSTSVAQPFVDGLAAEIKALLNGAEVHDLP